MTYRAPVRDLAFALHEAADFGRLSGAFGMTLSTLLEGVDPRAERHSRKDSQPVWQDPATGYRRRSRDAVEQAAAQHGDGRARALFLTRDDSL